jgi:hypothetical protein
MLAAGMHHKDWFTSWFTGLVIGFSQEIDVRRTIEQLIERKAATSHVPAELAWP